MDSLYFIVRFSKYLSRIVIVLAITFLIFVYFITLNGTKIEEDVALDEAYDRQLSSNRKTLLSGFEARIQREEYSVNKGEDDHLYTTCVIRMNTLRL